MKCIKCGKQIPKDSEFCEFCGEKIEKQIKPIKQKDSKKAKIGIIILSILLLLSISLIVILVLDMNVKYKYYDETISNLNNEIQELEKHTTSKVEESDFSKEEIDTNNLKSLGSFTSIKKLKQDLQRNLDNPIYMKVEITGYIIRTDSGIYLCTDFSPRINFETGYPDYELHRIDDNNKIRIYMKDDTQNRVLTGDKVKISGMINTKTTMIYDCTYEFAEQQS